MSKPIMTIGYEGRSSEEIFDILAENDVDVLLDVRIYPHSRKPGLSKSALAEECERRGIKYTHDKKLGTPKDLMEEEKETGEYDWDAYVEFLDRQGESLDAAAELSASGRTCLLCYEADASECHRRFVADRISDRTGTEVVHLPD